ncbi:unnamed protein product [Spirodela intermedia]|uniref:Uncharacterized protein n=1 Tax=Spirodela intermedia TaxID=51605 RepID=A0A7I8J3E0_SPIIN|nr:unnamed protein product [Spirodela intermedia]CAA6664492.1 unnamed protein product [Spirodela intermedia]
MDPRREKLVWVWTESKQVMTAAVERGWSTFLFPVDRRGLADDWSSIALINPLALQGSDILDGENKRVASFHEISSPQQLEQLEPDDGDGHVVIHLQGGWQVIPAENIVAAFQGCSKTVLAIASSSTEAQVFLEALEQGLGGVVLKVDNVHQIIGLKEYFDRTQEVKNAVGLSKATVTRVQVAGMATACAWTSAASCCPGKASWWVGSFARGLFLVHSECLESNYIASRPFRVNAGPVHAYVAVPGGKTCYLSELHAGKEVMVVDRGGRQRVAIVGRIKVESRSLVLVEAKEHSDDNVSYSLFLQNAETVGLVPPREGSKGTSIPVTSLKVGDEVLFSVHGGARHTGIEIQEFILEK